MTNSNIKQEVEIVNNYKKNAEQIRHLDNMSGDDKVLIFCNTARGSEDLNTFLNNKKFKCVALHGDKTKKE